MEWCTKILPQGHSKLGGGGGGREVISLVAYIQEAWHSKRVPFSAFRTRAGIPQVKVYERASEICPLDISLYLQELNVK